MNWWWYSFWANGPLPLRAESRRRRQGVNYTTADEFMRLPSQPNRESSGAHGGECTRWQQGRHPAMLFELRPQHHSRVRNELLWPARLADSPISAALSL